MPHIEIRHETTYRYAGPVSLGPHQMMLRPRETRDLRLVRFDLDVSPDARIDWSTDVAGNTVAKATFDAASDTLAIKARMIVDLTASVWPVFPISADAASYPFVYMNDAMTDLGPLAAPQYVDDAGRLSDWVEGFVMQRPTDTLSLLKDVANGVTAQVAYQSRETEGTQGPLDTLDRGWGTCRDFAVLFAEAARTLGFGARIVSGYLSNPNADLTGSAGDGSTHAWVEVFVPGAGWIPFDPTNQSVGGANLIPVAVARRIEQVAPVTGSFHGATDAQMSMDVSVSVKHIADTAGNDT
ncbi:transglutaminase family protein [uncultured Tateyamaria sp.]|uniref:transglutaminase family protein n=1 Tax=uncultured Tateyamaria sp. TaxID=455651 RepID=UPI00260B7DF8|nr:transglutaminase family protein [uncultured Tateyamaria sp.]